jgi:hypothetical protein
MAIKGWVTAHWSALALAVVGIGFLAIGAPSLEALAGAGFALLGAGITRWVDLAQAARRSHEQEAEARRRDLDETRRVAYMALLVHTTPKYELVATVANALAHHGSDIPSDEAVRHLTAVANGSTAGESAAWLRQQIDAITAKLDG